MLNYAPIYLATYHYAQNYAGITHQDLSPTPPLPPSHPYNPFPPYPSLASVPGSLLKNGTKATPSLHPSLFAL